MCTANDILLAFAEGRLEVRSFEQALYQNPALEKALSEVPAPPYAHTGVTLYHYLIALDWSDAGQALNAHGAVEAHLQTLGIPFQVDTKLQKAFDFLLQVQPHWLDVDPVFLQALATSTPTHLTAPQKKSWLKKRILELFRYTKKPPQWIQAPSWPVGPHGPLVFLGQLPIDKSFHDSAVVYVFYDSVSHQCQSILQTR